MCQLRTVLLVGALTAYIECGAVAAPFFMGLGDLPGGEFESRIGGISANGLVAVGNSKSDAGIRAFKWTVAEGITEIVDNTPDLISSNARGASADGSFVVGTRQIRSVGAEAIRWSQQSGVEGLGSLPGSQFSSSGSDISADGSVVVGSSFSARGFEAFRWTEQSGMVGLGDLDGGDFISGTASVSADGSIVVGSATSASGREAFRWTEPTGMTGIGDLPGGQFHSQALGISADGQVIVGGGRTTLADIFEPFTWEESSGFTSIGLGPDEGVGVAFDASSDGSIVVGRQTSKAFVWSQRTGLLNLKSVLENDLGLDLSGWRLSDATAISDDGKTIVGDGRNPDGRIEAWIAHLGDAELRRPRPRPIDEPPSIVILISIIAACSVLARKSMISG